jgi:hypothetical protein
MTTARESPRVCVPKPKLPEELHCVRSGFDKAQSIPLFGIDSIANRLAVVLVRARVCGIHARHCMIEPGRDAEASEVTDAQPQKRAFPPPLAAACAFSLRVFCAVGGLWQC